MHLTATKRPEPMDSRPMMACGHSANARHNGQPCCVICTPNPDAHRVVDVPDLTGRLAKCSNCQNTKPSSVELPFFEHRPGDKFDMFYDGCKGWN